MGLKNMSLSNHKNKRLVGLFFLGGLLLNYPILSLFNLKRTIWGIPLLYMYIFSIWLILVFCISLVTRQTTQDGNFPDNK
jgi:hypothetical protein